MSSATCGPFYSSPNVLTYWGWVTHICVGNLAIIGSDNGLSPGRRQPIIWTNAATLLIGPFGTNFSEILILYNSYIFIRENPFENVVWKMAAILSQPQSVNPPIHLCYTADWSHHPLNGSTPPLPRPTWTYMLRTYNKCLRNQEHYFFNTSYFECEKFCTCI